MELALTRIGNSRGIRLPSELIRRHGLENGLTLEVRGHEIILTAKSGDPKLSWEATAREMATAAEDWSDWEHTGSDGLDQIAWDEPQAKEAPDHRKSLRK
ncbi:MAG: AbrB/MazE/SpoVT family DNA-binding domain-containing protein [Verrucomicrobiota bacterium]